MSYQHIRAVQEILKIVGSDDQDLGNLAQISSYLGQGPNMVIGGLMKLESALQAKMGTDILAAKAYFDGQNARAGVPGAKAPSIYAKLLTSELATFEVSQGFNPQIQSIYLNELATQVFMDQSKKGAHFKDLISAAHGEYTHRLQWYLVLSDAPISAPGKQLFEKAVNVPGLWNTLFDRFRMQEPMAWGSEDFRCPENFAAYLTSQPFINQCPLIGNFLLARFKKRENMRRPPTSEGTWEQIYIARKLYRRAYTGCATAEKELVDKIVSLNVLDPQDPDVAKVYQPHI